MPNTSCFTVSGQAEERPVSRKRWLGGLHCCARLALNSANLSRQGIESD
jgi:hypothetical protein